MEHGNIGMEVAKLEDFPKSILTEKENPSYRDSWERFAATGKIGDYLEYLNKQKGEAGQEHMI